MNHDLPWLEEELAAHSQWVRRLARSLVHDESAAEDLVQDTWVAALRRPPTDRRALRGWLGRVVRTLAWKQQRRVSTAPTTGLAGDLPGGAPESELVERLELHRVLADELRALREPLRTTLLQRYFEGLSAAQIAERTGEPASTVRWRLQQGLEELRSRLDRRHDGSRDTWTAAFGALLARTDAARILPHVSGTAAIPILAMSTLSKLLLSLGALGALAVGFTVFSQGTGTPGLAGEPAIGDAATELLANGGAQTHEPARSLANPSAADLAPGGSAGSPAPAAAATLVDARCLDQALRPLPSAWMRCLEVEHSLAPADHDGRLELEVSIDTPREVRRISVGAPGMATHVVELVLLRGQPAHAGEFVLAPGGRVVGRVLDLRGQPLEGAQVLVLALTSDPTGIVDAEGLRSHGPERTRLAAGVRSTLDGSFAAEGLELQRSRAWARLGQGPWSLSEPFDLAAGVDVRDVVLRLETTANDRDIAGVLLAPDGSPVAGAPLSVQWEVAGRGGGFDVETDAFGRFLVQPRADCPHSISARAPEDRWLSLERRGIAPGTKGLELRFEAARSVDVLVLSRGAPVTKFAIGAARSARNCGEFEIPVPYATDRPEGKASLLVPAETFCVTVDAPGYWLKSAGPFSVSALSETLEIELNPLPGVRGRVLAGGLPVAGAKVQLNRVNEPGTFATLNGFLSFVAPYTEWKAATHGDGSFFIPLRDAGEYRLFADAPDFARAELGPLVIDVQKGLRDLELVLSRGGAVHGRVRMPPGRSPEGVIVGVNRGDALPLTRIVGPDGAFEFEHLTPGRWRLARSRETIDASLGIGFGNGDGERVLETNCDVLEGRTTAMDLDLREDRFCRLSGRVMINGSPAAGWSLQLAPAAEQVWFADAPKAALDREGRFDLFVECPGSVSVSLHAPAELLWRGEIERLVEVRPGAAPWNCELHAGSVTGRWTGDLASAPKLYYRSAAGADFEQRYLWIQRAPDGSFSIPLVPAGPGEIRARPADGSGDKVILEFTLAPGEQRELSLH